MNYSDHTPEQDQRHDDLLRRLVLLLDDGVDDQSSRPSEEALQAFLSGTATGDQEHQVLEALEKSRLYRKEVADIISDLETLQKGTETKPQQSDAPELPDMIRKHIDELPSGKIYRIRGITSFLAAAILIVTAVALLLPRGQEFNLLSESIERNTLIGLHSRGDSGFVTRTYDSGEDAALAAFRDVLAYDNAEFHPRSSRPETPLSAEGQRYSVTIKYPFTNSSFLYEALLDEAGTAGSAPRYYMLTLPSRNLYDLNADKESISVNWNLGRTEYICLTLVYPAKGAFAAAPARVFSTQ